MQTSRPMWIDGQLVEQRSQFGTETVAAKGRDRVELAHVLKLTWHREQINSYFSEKITVTDAHQIVGVRNDAADGKLQSSAHFVSTVIFSVQLHKLHSKVRTSKPFGPDTIPVNVIGPWHFGHGGRSISVRPGSSMRDCGICCPHKIRRERKTLSHR